MLQCRGQLPPLQVQPLDLKCLFSHKTSEGAPWAHLFAPSTPSVGGVIVHCVYFVLPRPVAAGELAEPRSPARYKLSARIYVPNACLRPRPFRIFMETLFLTQKG